jgi:hypothetical protein
VDRVNGGYALALVNLEGRRYRPAPPHDDPLAREARELARSGADWRDEQPWERYDSPWAFVRLTQEYALARDPSTLEAPASWPSALTELAVDALWAALAQRVGPRSSIGVAAMLAFTRFGLRRDGRRRAARRLGLTLDDAPRLGAPPVWLMAASVALRLRPEFRRGLYEPVPSWEFWLAVGIVRELEERRSWRQARRTSAGRPVSSD